MNNKGGKERNFSEREVPREGPEREERYQIFHTYFLATSTSYSP
jgi:hypothetical protein